MKKRFYPGAAVLVSMVAVASMTSMAPVYAAQNGGSSSAQAQSALPILQVTPTNGASVVRPDAPVQIVLDPSSPNFNRFHEQFVKGAYEVTINGVVAQATYDDTTHTITVSHNLFGRYSKVVVDLTVKASLHANSSSANDTSASFDFETGSAIGEATHVSASLNADSVSVVNQGELDVTATDDYGDPATNATVTVTGKGPGNARVASDFSAPSSVPITDGKADIALSDHSAETVALSYAVSDNTYHDAVDTHAGSASETFAPGPTAQIHAQAPKTVFVGSDTTISGDAEDVYGNSVKDGTAIKFSSERGNASSVTTQGGNFSIDYQASTVKGNDALSLTAGDSGIASSEQVYDRADHPAKVTVTNENLVAGSKGNITFNVYDKYGNLVENDEAMTLQFGNGTLPDETVNTNNGVADFALVSPTKAGTMSASISAETNAFVFGLPSPVTISAAAPAKATIKLPAQLTAGQSATISGVLTDQYGNPVANTPVSLTGVSGSAVTDGSGNFSIGFTPTSDTTSIGLSTGGTAISMTTDSGTTVGTSLPVHLASAAPQISVQDLKQTFEIQCNLWGQVATGSQWWGNESFSGRLVNANGQPLANQKFYLFVAGGPDKPNAYFEAPMTTDANGYFSTNRYIFQSWAYNGKLVGTQYQWWNYEYLYNYEAKVTVTFKTPDGVVFGQESQTLNWWTN